MDALSIILAIVMGIGTISFTIAMIKQYLRDEKKVNKELEEKIKKEIEESERLLSKLKENEKNFK